MSVFFSKAFHVFETICSWTMLLGMIALRGSQSKEKGAAEMWRHSGIEDFLLSSVPELPKSSMWALKTSHSTLFDHSSQLLP